ncbi:class V chitinase-like [Corylus avellana]|uniref:class V chitinase-like n=1 Tax=Corylus avellana TaxID=13451 RepID=UPI00286B46AB|nr:class V chitinase-like [Corylus avellana]
MATLLEECRVALESEADNSSQPRLILTVAAHYSLADFVPVDPSVSLPVESMQNNLDWSNIVAYHYYSPFSGKFYAPCCSFAWIARGLSANKLVLGLPFFGYMWTLKNSQDNGIGAPVTGLVANDTDTIEKGSLAYKDIKRHYIQTNSSALTYNANFVVNYCIIRSNWITFDDVEAVQNKVLYAIGLE